MTGSHVGSGSGTLEGATAGSRYLTHFGTSFPHHWRGLPSAVLVTAGTASRPPSGWRSRQRHRGWFFPRDLHCPPLQTRTLRHFRQLRLAAVQACGQ
jgi:hypothetical protein